MEELLREQQYQPNHPAPWIEEVVVEEFENAKKVGVKRLFWEKKYIANIPNNLFTKSNFIKQLKIISLSSNQLTSLPDTFGNCNALQELDISSNKFERFPSCILKLSNLEKLRMERNCLNGLPSCLAALQKLTFVSFFGNKISEIEDDCFAGMNQLREIDLECNYLTMIPQSLVDLQSVTENFFLRCDDLSAPANKPAKKPVKKNIGKKRTRPNKAKAPPAKRQRKK